MSNMSVAKQIASHGKQKEPDKVKVMARRKVKEPHEEEPKTEEKVIKKVVKKPSKESVPAPVVEPPVEAPPVKKKRTRQPLTPEQKEKALANLQKAREAKLAKKTAK